MSLPASLPWIFGVLLGWAAIRFAAARLARSRNARLVALAAALKADERYGERDGALIDDVLAESRGNAAAVVFPILIPTALLALAWAGFRRRMSSSGGMSPLESLELMRFREHELKLLDDTVNARGTVRGDPRFRRLIELAFEVEALRWPVVSLLTVAASLPALLLYLAAYGKRETVLVVPQLALLFAHTLRLLPRQTGSSP